MTEAANNSGDPVGRLDCVALIVSAGRGRRFGGDTPKQYLELGGRPLLARTLATFTRHPAVAAVRTVIHPDDRDLYDEAALGLALLDPVYGGDARQDSVRLGLESLEELAPRRVLIHDSVRPFVDAGTISRVVAALDQVPGAIPAIAVGDTLKRVSGGRVESTVERDRLWRAQTPQGFRYADILSAHRELAGETLTDDAAIAERAGLAVAIVDGAEDNIKVTRSEDFVRAQRLLGGGEMRIGSGFDVHRFEPGDHVILCGVEIPHDRSLAGHSDADAGLHAITDALLGAAGADDIGVHFPPGNKKWADAPSEVFLKFAGDRIAELGAEIINIDVTLICETPKITPHRARMAGRIAEILGIAGDRVNVKGTTTERLGFTGRGEGIAAQAVASIRLYSGGSP